MARRILPTFGCAIRRLAVSCETSVSNSCRQSLLRRHTYQPIVAVRHCVAPVQPIESLEEALASLNVKTIQKAKDVSRDVCSRGFLQDASTEDIYKFFEGTEIEECHTLKSRRQYTKQLFYIRFKDANSKEIALSRHKENYGERYIEVFDLMEEFGLLEKFVLRETSHYVLLANMPYDTETAIVKTWLRDESVDVKNVQFVTKGKCVIDAGSVAEADKLLKLELMLDGRKIFSSGYYISKE